MGIDSNVFSNPMGQQAFGGPSGGGIVASFTFATLPATYAVGQPVWVSDIGRALPAVPTAARGSLWMFDGTVWRPINGRVLLAAIDTSITGRNNSEVATTFQYAAPAGFYKVKDRLEMRVTLAKSGTTDSGIFRWRFGSAGTTGDSALTSATVMATSARHAGFIYEGRIEDATHAQAMARNDLGYGGTNTSALAGQITHGNVSGVLYSSVDAISSSTNDTMSIIDAELWLVR